MPRAIGAVIAGFVAWTVLFLGSNSLLSLASPTSFNADGSTDSILMLALILFLSIDFSVAAGYLASRIARTRAQSASIALGILLLSVGIIVQLQYWQVMPLWYHFTFLGTLLPGVLLGHRLEGRHS